MTDVIDLINAKDYNKLVRYCELSEIQSAIDSSIMLEHVYPVYLASCILINDLQSARHVRKRILATVNNTPEVNAIWSVVTALIQKSYPQVYQNLDSFQWSEYMVPLIQQVKASTREQMLIMIPNVYTSIELSQVCNYFGTSESDCLQELSTRGWKFDESTRVFFPVKPAPTPRISTNHNQFEKLADIVLSLEKF